MRAELAAATPHIDLSGFDDAELERFGLQRVAEAASCDVVVGRVIAELRTRRPERAFSDICRAVGVDRRNAYRWAQPFLDGSST